MGRSEVLSYGLLNRWPVKLHEDLWRWNQLLGDGVRRNSGCDDKPYLQYERDYIASALQLAGYDVSRYLGYAPRPTWVVDEEISLDLGSCWDCQTLEARYGYLQAFGTRAVTLIEAGASVAYSDVDGDGILDTATISVTTAVDPSEIQVFFRVADGADSAASELWQIDPLRVSAVGGTATITGHRSLFVEPSLWRDEYVGVNQNERNSGNLNTPAFFVTEVDVYRVYANATNAATVVSDQRQATVVEQPVTAYAVDKKRGLFRLEQTLPTDPEPEYPLTVRLSYLAGYPLVNGLMDDKLETAIIRLANTGNYMPSPTRSFCNVVAVLWDGDRAIADDASIASFENRTAFGVTNGALFATQVVRSMRVKGKGLPFPEEEAANA